MTVINTNYLALVSQNNLRTSKSALGSAIERLSSGLRINNSKDDAAGMAIANRMTAQIRGMTQAARNANDGISLAQTAEGNLKEINGNLQRIRELAVQAANDTNSKSDRKAINTEIAQRMEEIDRIAKSAEFNGRHLLDDGTGVDAESAGAQVLNRSVSFQIGANTNETQDVITINGKTLIDATVKGLGLDKLGNGNADGAKVKEATIGTDHRVSVDGTVIGKVEDNFDPTKGGELLEDKDGGTKIGMIGADGKIKDLNGKVIGQLKPNSYADPTNEIKDGKVYDKNGDLLGKADSEVIAGKAGKILDDDGKEVGKVDADGRIYKKDATTDSYTEAGQIPGFGENTSSDSLETIDAGTTAAEARALIRKIDTAMKKVDTGRANLGAIQNRFESTINNLNNTINNLSASRSRIEDADYAVEVSNMTRAQILQQAGTSVLAQANQVPQTVLSLLR